MKRRSINWKERKRDYHDQEKSSTISSSIGKERSFPREEERGREKHRGKVKKESIRPSLPAATGRSMREKKSEEKGGRAAPFC